MKEALNLALEALTYIYTETTADEDELIDQAITAIKEALAQPEGQSNFCAQCEALGRELVAVKQEQPYAFEAAIYSNDRININPYTGNVSIGTVAQPEQEPVAWLHTKIEGVAVPHRPADLNKHPDRWTALYKDPPPCPTCEALARTVMLDQTSHDTTPPQRQPLTDEQIRQVMRSLGWTGEGPSDIEFARAIEAAHGIGDKT